MMLFSAVHDMVIIQYHGAVYIPAPHANYHCMLQYFLAKLKIENLMYNTSRKEKRVSEIYEFLQYRVAQHSKTEADVIRTSCCIIRHFHTGLAEHILYD